jgi:predicted kinase
MLNKLKTAKRKNVMNKEIADKAVEFLKDNKISFLETYVSNIEIVDPKIAVFTAGMSGAGKTEYAQDRKQKEPFLLHIDTDEIRNFFAFVGYNGQNADLFQRPASRGVHTLFDEAIKCGYSIILDSNFADFDLAERNIARLIKRGYLVSINYIYDEPIKCAEYASIRESVTNRRVPMDVVYRSLKASFETTLKTKILFGESVVLNLFHRKDDKEYANISAQDFFEILKDEIKAQLCKLK